MDLLAIGPQNQSFSDQELDIIRRSRESCIAKLRVLRDEIQRLCCEAEGLEVQIHQYDIALAPHNKLPPEILRRIFRLCCKEPAQIPTQNGGVYTISHVCSLWRRIALNTPEFWGSISIKLEQSNEHRIQVAKQWLSRAGNLQVPRSLTITSTKAFTIPEFDTWGEHVIHNFVMHYPWSELHLFLPHKPYIMQVKRLLDGPFADSLEVLDLECNRDWAERSSEFFAPTTRLTKLRHLRLTGPWTSQNLMTAIPWNQLQYLTLVFEVSLSRCLDILSQCTSLVSCRLHVVRDVDDDSAPSSANRGSIILSSLRVLRLFFRSDILVEQLIRFLSLPNLAQLTLRQKYFSVANLGTPAICELLQRSNGMPDLGSLDLQTSDPINIRDILSKMPQLQRLHVRTGIFDQELRDDIATGTLAPRLHTITTRVRHHPLEILQMAELRHHNTSLISLDSTKQVTAFSRLTFYCHNRLDIKSEKRLAALKKAVPGLSISFVFRPNLAELGFG